MVIVPDCDPCPGNLVAWIGVVTGLSDPAATSYPLQRVSLCQLGQLPLPWDLQLPPAAGSRVPEHSFSPRCDASKSGRPAESVSQELLSVWVMLHLLSFRWYLLSLQLLPDSLFRTQS